MGLFVKATNLTKTAYVFPQLSPPLPTLQSYYENKYENTSESVLKAWKHSKKCEVLLRMMSFSPSLQTLPAVLTLTTGSAVALFGVLGALETQMHPPWEEGKNVGWERGVLSPSKTVWQESQSFPSPVFWPELSVTGILWSSGTGSVCQWGHFWGSRPGREQKPFLPRGSGTWQCPPYPVTCSSNS